MSTHLLGNVQLITKQEVEAMLGAVVTPESEINSKIAALESKVEIADEEVKSLVAVETSRATAAEALLESKLEDEAVLRDTAVDTLQNNLDAEASTRQTADTAIVESITLLNEKVDGLGEIETEELSNLKCVRLKRLPIATIQVDNNDKTIANGHTIATVNHRFLPAIPIDFTMASEQLVNNAPRIYLLSCRLDTAGNIRVIHKMLMTSDAAATDTASVTYITKE